MGLRIDFWYWRCSNSCLWVGLHLFSHLLHSCHPPVCAVRKTERTSVRRLSVGTGSKQTGKSIKSRKREKFQKVHERWAESITTRLYRTNQSTMRSLTAFGLPPRTKGRGYTRDWKLKRVQLELVLPLHQTPLKKSDSLVLRKFRTGSCDFHSSHTTLCQK